jgi:hypothetical protein
VVSYFIRSIQNKSLSVKLDDSSYKCHFNGVNFSRAAVNWTGLVVLE